MSEAAQTVQRAVDEMKKENGEKEMAKKTRKAKANGKPRAKKEKAPKKVRAAKTEPDGFINANVGKALRDAVVKRAKSDEQTINQVVRAALEKYV